MRMHSKSSEVSSALQSRPLTEAERELVENAMLGARLLRPYYRRALAALQPFAVDGLGTVAVDEHWRLYVDTEWFETLDDTQRAGVIATHEVEHLLRRHGARAGEYHPMLWNLAGDAEINDDTEDKYLPVDTIKPRHFKAPDGLTAEEYMSYIEQQVEVKQVCACGSGAHGRPQEYEQPADADGARGVTAPEAEAIRRGTAADVQEYAREHGRGELPAGVLVWAEAEARRVAPAWQKVLARWLGASGAEARGSRHSSWSRIDRRQLPGMPLWPGLVSAKPRIACVVDTSGSMSEVGDSVLSIVRFLGERCKGELLIVDCDAEVAQVKPYKKNFKHRGGGGTDMREGFEAAAKARVDGVVLLTDGYTPWPEIPPEQHIVVLLGGGNTEPPPAGWVWVRE